MMRIVLATLSIFLALVAAGVDARPSDDAYLDAVTAIVATPRPAADVLRIIDDGRVDVNRPYADGNSLMHYTAIAGRADVMKGLLARGGRLDLPRQQSDRATAADLARKPEIAAYLISIGATKPALSTPATPLPRPTPVASPTPQVSPRRAMCNARHYSSSSLCSDTTCKMREYRKWQTCLQTGSYS